MDVEIKWTKNARRDYDKIIDYLEKNWTEKEIINFIKKTHNFIDILKSFPKILKRSVFNKELHRGPINKHTIITYRLNQKEKIIEIISITASKEFASETL